MRRLHALFYRAVALFRRRTHESDMAEEMRLHMEALVERNLAAGMPPDEARYAAQRAFGGVEQLKEKCRDERRFRWGEEAWIDVRHALRLLWKSPGFTVFAVLSLVIGLGANTAVFTLCNEILLQPLPVPHPSELVVLRYEESRAGFTAAEINGERTKDARGRTFANAFPPLAFARMRGPSADVVELFAFAPLPQLSALIGGQPELVPLTQIVSGNFYSALGLQPRLGRLIAPRDDAPGAAPVAVISSRYWQRRFSYDPGVIGKVIWLNNVPVTIVGVTPANFSGTLQVGESPDLFVPLTLAPRLRPDAKGRFEPGQSSYWWLRIMGRLGPDATPAELEARLATIFRDVALATYPENGLTPAAPRLVVADGRRGLDEARQSYRPSLLILSVIAALVLLIACLNVANLLLARATARRREFAVRLALGATRGRLVRQWLVESLLLAGFGAVLGLLLARFAGILLLALRPAASGAPVFSLHLDWRVLGFTALVAAATTLVFGLSPALRATRLDLKAEFQAAGGSQRRGRLAPAKLLIVVQVALSLVLLVGAGLFTRTLRNLQAVEPGFNPAHLLLFQVDAVAAGRKRDQVAELYRRVNERIATVPGVRASTFSIQPLLGGGKLTLADALRHHAPGAGDEPSLPADVNGIGAGFFATYQIPVIAGRAFVNDEPPGTIVVNATLARSWFGDEAVVGRSLGLGEIVGVVADSRYGELKQPVGPTVYVPFSATPAAGLNAEFKGNFAVRTVGDPLAVLPALRRALRDIDPKLPLSNARTQEAEMDRQLQQERLFAQLSTVCGGLAVVLLCVGLYGLMSFAVLHRTTEIGVRMALGAQPGSVQTMILRESLALVGVGLGIGLLGAAVVVPHVKPLLFELSPADPLIYGAVGLLLLVVGAAASWLPARRAAQVDAMTALRCE